MFIVMGMENGLLIEGEIKNFKYFYDCGICYIMLVYF